MKIILAAITLIKNEDDIIYASLENLYFLGVKCFAVMDNFSSDATLQEIERFRVNHVDVKFLIVHDFNPKHQQSRKTTALAKMAGEYFSATHIYPFDADEFLLPSTLDDSGGIELIDYLKVKDLRLFRPYGFRWRTCIRDEKGSIYACGISLYSKVLVRWRDSIVFSEGNHAASLRSSSQSKSGKIFRFLNRNILCKTMNVDAFEVMHLPVRSATQLANKILQGSKANEINRNTRLGEHWMEAFKLAQTSSFDEFYGVLQRGDTAEMNEFCRRFELNRGRLAYFNDYFLPRTLVKIKALENVAA